MESGSWMLPGDSGRIAGIKGRMLPDPAALPSRLLRTLVLTLLAAMAWASAEGAEARNFGTIPVGTTSPALCVTFLFTTEGTLGSKPAVVTQGIPDLDFKLAEGGTLGAGFRCHPGQSGTVKVTFTPQHPGPRYGAVNLADASGNLMATVCLQGAGSGPQVAFLPGVATRIGSGFCVPIGVAVDAGGNVFLADTYNNRVVKATPSGGTYTQTTAVSGSFRPVAIALDGGGNLYIYDTAGDDYDGRILKETLSEGRYTETIVASRCGQRGAMAVDADGNLCVADTDHGKVVKYTLANGAYTRTELASGFADPNAIAVDASGNLYVVNQFTKGPPDNWRFADRVVKLTPSRGTYTLSTVADGLIDDGAEGPGGIAVDGIGQPLQGDFQTNDVVALPLLLVGLLHLDGVK